MAQKLTSTEPVVVKSKRGGLIAALCILPLLFALGAGVGVYFYLKSTMTIKGITEQVGVDTLQKQLDSANLKITSLQDELMRNGLATNTELDTPQINEEQCTKCDLLDELPVVSYERAGLLTDAQRAELQQKLIDPYFDYYNETELTYIAMVITVPETVGEPFEIQTITRTGAGEGFLYSRRGEPLNWWTPTCMDECPFSNTFRDKYPEIVQMLGGA